VVLLARGMFSADGPSSASQKPFRTKALRGIPSGEKQKGIFLAQAK
jgi:hypothetical protein